MMRYTQVHTVQDFVVYSRSILAEHPELMSDEEQKKAAGLFTVLLVNDEYHNEWQKYPQIIQILDIAPDLEWLNTDNAKGDWNRIRELVDELQERVKSEV